MYRVTVKVTQEVLQVVCMFPHSEREGWRKGDAPVLLSPCMSRATYLKYDCLGKR